MDKWEHGARAQEKRWDLMIAATEAVTAYMHARWQLTAATATDRGPIDALDLAAFTLVDHLRTPITCSSCGQGLPPHPPHGEELLFEANTQQVTATTPWGKLKWMQRRTGEDLYREIPEMPEGIITVEKTEPREDEGKVYVFFRSV